MTTVTNQQASEVIRAIDKMRLADGYDEVFENGYNAAIDDVLKILRHSAT